MKQYSQYIGASNGVHHLTSANGNTKDIMNTVLFADGKAHEYCRALAAQLNVPGDPVQTCYNIWKFWKENVKYVEDPDGWQFIKSPAYLYETAEGDCKSYSVAVGSCLKQLGIPYAYRFISQEANKPFHHVYIVAYTKAGQVLIDCVIDLFNKENHYARKRDVPPANQHAPQPSARIGKAHGIHYIPSHIGRAFKIGATQAEVYNSQWQQFDKAFADNKKTIYDNCKNAGLADIENEFPNAIVRRNKIKKAWKENFDDFVTSGQLLTYLYWDSSKATLVGYVVIDGQTIMMSDKKLKGQDFRDNLQGMGIRSGTLQALCALSVFKTYGITLEHLLDRCYNMVNYGQPWKPAPGVPYYNFKTGVFVNQGTTAQSLQTTLKIAMCFPAAGGVTRPFGQPYLSVGGWYIQNGATDAAYNEYVANYHWSQNEKDHVVNNGTGLNSEEFAACWSAYQQWISGNMPALPASEVFGGGKVKISGARARIGAPGVAEIVGIIVGLITALVMLGKFIKEMVTGAKEIPAPRYFPTPPPDFQMEYQTVDGCYIGRAPAECGDAKAKYCPDGTFTCLTVSDLGLPQNQPGTPAGNGFLGNMGNKWLFVAAAALLAAFFFSGSSKVTHK